MKTKNFIELTNASGKKLDRLLVRIDDISAIEEPQNTETVGCILLVNDQLIAVKESYAYLKSYVQANG